jgi:hypothetical protein
MTPGAQSEKQWRSRGKEDGVSYAEGKLEHRVAAAESGNVIET